MSAVFVVRERTCSVFSFENEKHYGPISLTGVASTFENAEKIVENAILAYGDTDESLLPDLNWREVGFGSWYCTTTDGNWVSEWWLDGQQIQTRGMISDLRQHYTRNGKKSLLDY